MIIDAGRWLPTDRPTTLHDGSDQDLWLDADPMDPDMLRDTLEQIRSRLSDGGGVLILSAQWGQLAAPQSSWRHRDIRRADRDPAQSQPRAPHLGNGLRRA